MKFMYQTEKFYAARRLLMLEGFCECLQSDETKGVDKPFDPKKDVRLTS